MSRRAIVIPVMAAAVAVGVWLAAGAVSSPARAASPRIGSAGMETAYELRWRMSSDAQGQGDMGAALGGRARGTIELTGRLRVRRLDPAGDRIAMRLERVDAARVVLLDQVVIEDATADTLVGHEIVVERSPDSTDISSLVSPGTPAVAGELLRAIAEQLQIAADPGTTTYDVTGPAVFGRATDRYETRPGELTRSRLRYEALSSLPVGPCPSCTQVLDGRATIRLAPSGAIQALTDRETLRVVDGARELVVADNELELELVESRAATTAPPALDDWTRIDPASMAAAAEDELRRRIAGDLDLTTLDGWILRYAATGTTPIDPMWIAQAAAFLQLHPEHCEDLLALFAEDGQTTQAQLMILDILVATGTPEAQAALRRAVDLGAALADDVFGAMVSRLGFVTEPTPETVAYVSALRGRLVAHGPTAQGSALYTEGAMIGQLAKIDPAGAVERVRGLEAELAATTDAAQRAHILAALGNADVEAAVPTVLDAAVDPAPEVRAAAADALRRRADAHASVLLELAADPHPLVQHAALRVLAYRGNDETLARLAEVVADGRVRSADVTTLVKAFARGAGRVDGVDAALEALLAQTTSPAVAAEIRALLSTPG